ncbi:MAG: thiol oxidoreductase, partial [Prevotellaceae bacterium]|nr:thiol oxidoreductase [Prevotellaceae bacterium]
MERFGKWKVALIGVVIFITAIFIACNKDSSEIILKPNGRPADPAELSAGNATVFMTSLRAYDTPAPWVTGTLMTRFLKGDKLYDDPRTSNQYDSQKGGLGPLYAGFSCGSCHNNAGRTYPSLFSNGGSGKGFSAQLAYITRQNGVFFRQYGRVLHDQSIVGVEPEGKLSVIYEEKKYYFHDGEEYSLATPHYSITEWYADSIAPEDLIIDVHIPLRHVGMGQIMALDIDELKRLASLSNYPEYGISGRLSVITERNKQYVGVGGNKAHHADLTVELGFSSDLGVTNARFPLEVCEGQSQNIGYSHYGIQITTKDMEDVDLYMYTLGVPARRNVNNVNVKKGEENFYKAKCHLCHAPTL